jgi:hypothetical protein
MATHGASQLDATSANPRATDVEENESQYDDLATYTAQCASEQAKFSTYLRGILPPARQCEAPALLMVDLHLSPTTPSKGI